MPLVQVFLLIIATHVAISLWRKAVLCISATAFSGFWLCCISAGSTLALGSSAHARIIVGRSDCLVVVTGILALKASAMISAKALLVV